MAKKVVKKKRKIINVRPLGTNVLASGKGPPRAYLTYEAIWSDGTYSIERGTSLHTVLGFDHLNGRPAQIKKAYEYLRTDLFEVMQALSILLAPVERACVELDEKTLFVGDKKIHEVA
jgi:hypothetical protein